MYQKTFFSKLFLKNALKRNKLVCNLSKNFYEKHNIFIYFRYPLIETENMLIITLKLKNTQLAVKVIVFIIFSENIDAMNMSEYTLKCTKLHCFLNFLGGACSPMPLSKAGCITIYPILSKLFPLCLNMD